MFTTLEFNRLSGEVLKEVVLFEDKDKKPLLIAGVVSEEDDRETYLVITPFGEYRTKYQTFSTFPLNDETPQVELMGWLAKSIANIFKAYPNMLNDIEIK